MDSNAKMTESRQQSEKPGNHEEYHELEESHGYAASASSSSSSESDTDPRDYTYEGRIKHAQERMGDRTAFFYGTLMAKEVLYRVIFGTSNPSKHAPITITTTPALLPNHLRTRVLHADYPAVTPSPGHSVLGTYVTGLTNADIYRLDLFEGPQYTLRDVKIRLLKKEGDAKGHGNVEGKEVETQTYIWIAGDDLLEHAEWDIETFRREKLRRWVGDSDEFQESDAAQDWNNDTTAHEPKNNGNIDPTGGRGLNGHIGKALDEEHAKMREGDGNEGEPLKSAV